MNSFLILLSLMACACASPNTVLTSTYPYTYTWPYSATVPVAVTVPVAATYSHVPAVVSYTVPAYTKTQYHAQDEQGRASYGYSHPGQSHQTVRDEQGNVQGSYAYVDPTGNEVRVNYVADQGGFRAATNTAPAHQVRAKRSLVYNAYHPVTSHQVVGYSAATPGTSHHVVGYSAATPVTYSYSALRPATLTQITHNPGHAVSYRVD